MWPKQIFDQWIDEYQIPVHRDQWLDRKQHRGVFDP